jgi:hypothetical protein
MDCQVGSAPACYSSTLGSNPDISQKYKMGDKKIYKKTSSGFSSTFKPLPPAPVLQYLYSL